MLWFSSNKQIFLQTAERHTEPWSFRIEDRTSDGRIKSSKRKDGSTERLEKASKTRKDSESPTPGPSHVFFEKCKWDIHRDNVLFYSFWSSVGLCGVQRSNWFLFMQLLSERRAANKRAAMEQKNHAVKRGGHQAHRRSLTTPSMRQMILYLAHTTVTLQVRKSSNHTLNESLFPKLSEFSWHPSGNH